MVSKGRNSQTTAWTTQRNATLNCPSLLMPFGSQCYPLMPINPALCTHALHKRKLGHVWHRLVFTFPSAHETIENGWNKQTDAIWIASTFFLHRDSHIRPKCGPSHLLRLHSGSKCSPSQGLYPQVKPQCFQSMWTLHSDGNSLLMERQGCGVRGFLGPHLFSGPPPTPPQKKQKTKKQPCPLCMLWPRKWGLEQIVIRNSSVFVEHSFQHLVPICGDVFSCSISP